MASYTSKEDYWEYKAKLSYQDMNELGANDVVFQTLQKKGIQGMEVYRVDGDNIGITAGSCFVDDDKFAVLDAAKEDLTYPTPDDGDWIDVWCNVSSTSDIPTYTAVDAGTVPGSSENPGTYGRIIGSIFYHNSTYQITYWNRYRDDVVYGWRSFAGNNTAEVGIDITYGVTFADVGFLKVDYISRASTTPPTDLTAFANEDAASISEQTQNLTTTAGRTSINASTGTFSSSNYHGFMFSVTGSYS